MTGDDSVEASPARSGQPAVERVLNGGPVAGDELSRARAEFRRLAVAYAEAADDSVGDGLARRMNELVTGLDVGGDAERLLIPLLEEGEPAVQVSAAATLVGRGEPPRAAISALRSLRRNDSPVVAGLAHFALMSYAHGYFLNHEADGTPASFP